MPPKKQVWKKTEGNLATPTDIGRAGKDSSSVVAATVHDAMAQIKAFIVKTVKDNNLLQLPDEEIQSIAQILVSTKDKAEILEWCGTLMQPDSFAAEIIKRREDSSSRFSAQQRAQEAPDDTASEAGSVASTTASKKRGKGQRGKALTSADDPSGGLVAGAKFECGCFAAQHQYLSNCLNCGRIFCKQESDEWCYSCGMDPKRNIASELRAENSKVDAASRNLNQVGYEKAVAQRDQLLQFAQERAKRTIVIDDQSGHFANVAWVSKAEREAAERAYAEERKKIAELHRSSGAFTVHLDIVSQNVTLGANALQAPDAKKAVASANAEDLAFDGQKDETSAQGANEPQPQTSSNEVTDDDEDILEEEKDLRVMPLPTLVQQVFYDDGTGAPQASSAPKSTSEAKAQAKARDKSKAKESVGHEGTSSRRVQMDYFEDDALTFKTALQELEDQDPEDMLALQLRFDANRLHSSSHQLMDTLATGDAQSTTAASAAALDESESQAATSSAAAQPTTSPTFHRTPKDTGMCLSMHQPWASLLTAGIKIHEGRGWPTEHRGRLWIHAAAAKPMNAEEIENHYQPFMKPGQKLPSNYPTSCLLGCVNVVDCLSQDRYKAEIPEEQQQEGGSEYTFICENARTLPFFLPMDGKHKIFKLEKKMWNAARKQLNETQMK